MKNCYTIDELKAIMFTEEQLKSAYSRKYRKLRNKFADMPQEQFDDYYRAFVGTSGVIGPRENGPIGTQELAMFNAIAEWFNTYGKHREALSVSDIMVEAYKCADWKTKEAIRPRLNEVDRWNGGVYYSIVESFQAKTRDFLIKLAEQGELEHIEIKTRGRVHLNMFRVK